MVDDWGTATGGGEPPPRPPDHGRWRGPRPPEDPTVEEDALPGWMRRAPSADYGSRGETFRERRRHLVDKARGRTPLNAPVYAYVQRVEGKPSFWSAGKGVLLGTGFAAGSLALALTLVALVRTDPDDARIDPDGGVAIAGDPTTTLPGGVGFDDGKVPLEAPTSSETSTTTDGTTTTESAPTTPGTGGTTTPPTAPPTTAPPTTAAPTTTTRPTTTLQPAPVITSLRADRTFGFCRDRDEIRVEFSWSTTNATSAQFGLQGRSTSSVGTNDSRDDCVDRGSTWVLSVSGPGGTNNRTVTAS